MNRTSIEIEAEILKKKLEESMAARKRQQEKIEEQEEQIRDMRQLAANQDAEITELRRRMAGISSVLDDLIESETKERQILEGCRNVLEKMKAEADRI